jgi:AraC family transcriptional activator of pobA
MTRKKSIITSYKLEDLSGGLPFVIERIDTKVEEYDQILEPHRHGYYAIAVCLEGESTHMVDFERIDLHEKDIMMIVPGQVHHPIGIHKGSGWLIAFCADFLAGLPVSPPLAATPKINLAAADFAQVLAIIQLMEKESMERAPQYAAVLQHFISVLITLIKRHTSPANAQSGPTLLFRFRELLATHFMEWTKPTQYAGALHISADHLNEVVKQHTAQTASAIITERRILEAKRLLLHAKESIKEIAWYLQFNEVSYFNKYFKQHTGYTPASFRDALREKYPSTPE